MSAEKEVLNFVLVGAKQTGKTVYLSTLYGAESSITTTNKPTKTYLQEQWNHLKEGNTPSATSARLILLDLVYKSKDYNVPFRIDDYDGYFAESLSDDDPATQKDRDLLKNNIKEAEGLLLFFPYEETLDVKSIERFRHEINTFITLVRQVFPNKNDLPIPVVIAVSKWDRSPYFKTSNEIEKAVEYINSVEPYSAAMEMVENYFANVLTIPFSSFGVSNDGMLPIKGKIEPHNITTSLDFFLEHFFSVFEQRVAILQKENDLPRLFQFLFQWMHVVKFHDNERFKRLFDDVTKQYKDEILSQLRNAQSKEDQKEILEKHRSFLQNSGNTMLEKEIRAELSRTGRAKRKKLISYAFIVIVLVGGLCFGIFEFLQYRSKTDLFIKIRGATNVPPHERIDIADEYLSKFSLAAEYLPKFRAEKAEVEQFQAEAWKQARQLLADRYEAVRNSELTEENFRAIEELNRDALLYPKLDLANNIRDFAMDFEERFNRKKEDLRKRKEAITAGKNLLEILTAELEDVSDTIAALRMHEDDEEVAALIKLLERKRRELEIKEIRQAIVNELKSLKDEKVKALDISEIIQRNRIVDFSQEQRKSLTKLIHDKFKEMDSKAIKALKGKYESKDEIKKDKDKIEAIKDHRLEIRLLDDYRYVRSDSLIKELKKAKNGLKQYQDALDNGIDVQVSFIAESEDNKPLGFKCSGISNEDIVLEIESKNDKWEFHYKKHSGECSIDGSKQVMTWQKHMCLQQGKYFKVIVIEMDALFNPDDQVKGGVKISDVDLFKIMNKQRGIEVPIKNTDYYIRFSRR